MGGANKMKKRNGFFLVIEGTDGSGKGTQSDLLKKNLLAQGYEVATFDFPQYDKSSSYFVKQYLNGEYGSAEEVGPYTGSLFYALDRYEASKEIQKALDAGKIVLANRFTGSNMAHQGTKFDNIEQRRGYFIWLDQLEFEMLKIPRPDLSLVLRVPAEIAQELVDKKQKRVYTDKKRDLHEADINHLRRSVEVYYNLCQLFPKDFRQIDCIRSGKMLGVDKIQNLILETIKPYLPNKKTFSGKTTIGSTALEAENQFLTKKDDGTVVMTSEGRAYLEELVTDVDGNVYGFSEKMNPLTVAAAMARLSRRGDDMRVILLDEFLGKEGKDEDLIKRVITAFGDDSVQQLVGQHIVVENASNLLTKKLEWGRLAAYLEQSTRYIYYDQKDANNKYKYFIPNNLNPTVKAQYKKILDNIFDLYSEMVHALTEYVQNQSSVSAKERDMAWRLATRAQACDAVRPVLPVATKATVGIFASGQALESLIMHLLGDELPEARKVGEEILREARKNIPAFLERADKPSRGGATIAYKANSRKALKKLADKMLKSSYSTEYDPVNLVSVWPRNELDIVSDVLYPYSDASRNEILKQVSSWSYNKKQKVFESFVGERLNRRHRPGRALEKIHYSWDLVCDYGIFRDLQRHRMVDDLVWQALSPRYGYDVPELIEEAGLLEKFQRCFDLSLELFSILQSNGYMAEAEYATLLGHKMRWKLTFNAREAMHFIELRTSPQGHPGYRKLAKKMYDKICEVHPLIGEAMKFVNQDEDPELTRLASERYTQFKLDQLDKD